MISYLWRAMSSSKLCWLFGHGYYKPNSKKPHYERCALCGKERTV